MPVSKRLRYEILRRDNHACRYCGGVAPDAVLTVDHVVPSALGGSDDPSNLVAACRDCNAGKSSASADASLVADVTSDALRWAAAMRHAVDLATADAEEREARCAAFDDYWGNWHTTTKRWENGGQVETHHPIPMDNDWERTVDRFYGSGLTESIIYECVRIAMGSQARPDATWRYFCGVAWRKLRELQDAAQATLAEEVAVKAKQQGEVHYALKTYYELAAVCDGEVPV